MRGHVGGLVMLHIDYNILDQQTKVYIEAIRYEEMMCNMMMIDALVVTRKSTEKCK